MWVSVHGKTFVFTSKQRPQVPKHFKIWKTSQKPQKFWPLNVLCYTVTSSLLAFISFYAPQKYVHFTQPLGFWRNYCCLGNCHCILVIWNIPPCNKHIVTVMWSILTLSLSALGVRISLSFRKFFVLNIGHGQHKEAQLYLLTFDYGTIIQSLQFSSVLVTSGGQYQCRPIAE